KCRRHRIIHAGDSPARRCASHLDRDKSRSAEDDASEKGMIETQVAKSALPRKREQAVTCDDVR
ncbi:hypothetical protein BaRGS_00028619, partial [Batillaria attramentaria]